MRSGDEQGGARRLEIQLSARQQSRLMAPLSQIATQRLGIGEAQAGSIIVETLARLTPDMTTSEFTLLRVLEGEIGAYSSDPRAYEARAAATEYHVRALEPDAPVGLGALSQDILELHAPTVVPLNATPQEEWWDFSHEVDGYRVAERLGWDLGDLALTVLDYYRATGRWRGSLLDLRLTLFWKARALRHSGEALEDTGEEAIEEVASLLNAIATRTPT